MISARRCRCAGRDFERAFRRRRTRFRRPRPDAFFVRVATVRFDPSSRGALGRPARAAPAGPDAGAWRRWHSEIEMLLHEHPVNVERERAGARSPTAPWFSGGGSFRRDHRPPSIRTYATTGIAAALARLQALRCSPAQPTARRVERCGRADSIVVALDRALDVPAIERHGPRRRALRLPRAPPGRHIALRRRRRCHRVARRTSRPLATPRR